MKENELEHKEWRVDNIVLSWNSAMFAEKTLHNAKSEEDVVRLHFGIKGNYEVTYKQIGRTFGLIGGHLNLFYSLPFEMAFYNKTLRLETFGVQFPKQQFIELASKGNDSLKQFADDIQKNKNIIYSNNWVAISLSLQHLINQILQTNNDRGLQQLFLYSKSIELLTLAVSALDEIHYQKKTDIIKNSTDKEKIIAARDIINANLQAPLGLTALSKMVGLNVFKLKNGFKQIFKTTVLGYVTEQRLNLAVDMLKNTEMSVAEISFEMGYNTPQYFNNAFKKKYGFTPKSVRNNP